MRSHLVGVALVVAAMVVWSTVPVGTRLLMRDTPAFSAAFISAARLWIAAAIFIIIRAVYARRSGRPFHVRVTHYGWLLIAAAALCFNYIFYAIGLRYTTAGATSIVSQVHPIATVLLAALLLNERLTRQKVVGMLLAITGVLLVVFHGESLHDLFASDNFAGNLIEIMAALSWPFYAIGQTKLMSEHHDEQSLLPIFVTAALLSCIMLPFTGPLIIHSPRLLDWATLLFLGAGSTALAYWLFAAGLQRIQTSEGAMFNVLMPLTALFMAHWVLGEPLHANMLFGLMLVLCGLALIVWRRGQSPLRVRLRRVALQLWPNRLSGSNRSDLNLGDRQRTLP